MDQGAALSIPLFSKYMKVLFLFPGEDFPAFF